LTWQVPTPFESALSYSFGRAVAEHGHEEHEEEEHGEEEAGFESDIHTMHWRGKWESSESHHFAGHLSAAYGDNTFGSQTAVYAAGLESMWRLEHGRHLRLRAAAMARDIGTVKDVSYSEWGVSSSVDYGLNENWATGVGVAWVEGIGKLGIDERFRISPVLTWNASEHVELKLQYNYDRLASSQTEHSVWLGFGFSWGAHEHDCDESH
jgi:hypothetical protein